MSQQLISRSPDLKRLRDEGYDVEIRNNYLLVKNVPYVNAAKEVKLGTLVSELTLAGDRTAQPNTHVVQFAGEFPCDKNGSKIAQIEHVSARQTLGDGLVTDHSFSSKPANGYRDYHEKMATYAAILSGPAEAIDPSATPRPFRPIADDGAESVFRYIDTASSRAGINMVTRKLEGRKIAIVGLGGTGAYVLDAIAKTPVSEIHLFDGDKFSQHNAFRSPGAADIEELNKEPLKVDYFSRVYGNMHRHVIPHAKYIDASNVGQLDGMDSVFLCLDRGEPKRIIVERLETSGVPFIDAGMGIYLVDDALGGIVRVTASTPLQREHVRQRVSFGDGDGDDAYAQNIQIADLNALNAALAVIKWKKMCGFYLDFEREHHTTYTIDMNMLLSEDNVAAPEPKA